MKKEITRKNFTPKRDDFVLKMCKDKNILHIGACDWPYTEKKFKEGLLLYDKIDKICKKQLGIDLDKKSIDYLNKLDFKRSNVKFYDMNTAYKLNFKAEVIIFGETIEHIMNLETALRSLKKIMNKNTKLIISTPNSENLFRVWSSLKGYEIQHPDHNLIFSYKTLKQLLEKNQLKVVDIKFTFANSKNTSFLNKILVLISRFFPIFSGTLLFIVKK